MGKLVIPKHEGKVDTIMKVMKVYYDRKDCNYGWVDNTTLKKELGYKKGDKDPSSYTKKGQVAAYFGFIEYQGFEGKGLKNRRITKCGKKIYEAYINKNNEEIMDLLVNSLEEHVFGRKNYACPTSNSDVEAPSIMFKAICQLEYITSIEFATLLYRMHNKNDTYENTLKYIIKCRVNNESLNTENLERCWRDPKSIISLERFGLLKSREENGKIKIYELPKEVKYKYYSRFINLEVYNREVIDSSNISDLEIDNDELEKSYEDNLEKVEDIYTNEAKKDELNNREPKKIKTSKGSRYKTDSRIKKAALSECKYMCFYDSTHELFEKKNGKNYVEGHHIIPMSAQDDFKINLDRTENVVALCPHCHKAIHHGNKSTVMSILEKIFEARKEELNKVSISIDISDLYEKYYK